MPARRSQHRIASLCPQPRPTNSRRPKRHRTKLRTGSRPSSAALPASSAAPPMPRHESGAAIDPHNRRAYGPRFSSIRFLRSRSPPQPRRNTVKRDLAETFRFMRDPGRPAGVLVFDQVSDPISESEMGSDASAGVGERNSTSSARRITRMTGNGGSRVVRGRTFVNGSSFE